MSDPRNTATTQPAADRAEMLSDDPHGEFDAHRALATTAKMAAPETAKTPYNERSEKGKKTHDRNGYIRLGLMVAGLVAAYAVNHEWPVFIAVGIMLIFQMANGEGLE